MSQQHQIEIHTDFIELNKLLKFENLVESGGHAKVVIAEGLVKLNGSVVNQTRKKVFVGDVVEFNGESYKVVNQG